MYLFRILIIQVIQLLVRSASEPPVSTIINYDTDENTNKNIDYEKELIDAVNEYYYQIHEVDISRIFNGTTTNKKCGVVIEQDHILKLEINLCMILTRMFNYYHKQLQNMNEKKVIDLLKSEYVETICSHIPRCIDFINICTPVYTIIKDILNFHSYVCASRKLLLTENQPLDKPRDIAHSYKNYSNERINLSYSDFRNLYDFPIKTECLTAEGDGSFVKKIFEIVNKIDKTVMISNSNLEKKPSLLDFYVSGDLDIILPNSLILRFEENKPEIEILNRELKNILFEYKQMFLKTDKNNDIAKFNDNISNRYNMVHLLTKLMLNVLRGLEYHFKNGVSYGIQNYNSNENRSNSIDYNTMKNILSIEPLQKLCKHIPLILYYFSSNDITKDSLFSSYLTLCSDWIYFLSVRCECDKNDDGKMLYNLQCVKQSVEEKILLNYFKVMRTTEYDDNIFKNGVPDKQLLESIILKIYTELNKIFASEDIFLWPEFDWLTGINIYTQSFNCYDMDVIKLQNVPLDNEYEIPLLDMYNLLLPWNLNIKTLLGFHRVTEERVLNNIFQYVWRQAKMIIAYFDHTKVMNVKDEIFKRLQNSTQWYRSATLKFRRITNITGGKFIVPKGIRSIIEAIENVDENTFNDISSALQLTLNIEKKWKKPDILDYTESKDFLIGLNESFLSNCYDALTYVNVYISIINKLKFTSEDINTLSLENLCENPNLDGVVVASQVQTGMCSENNDEDHTSEEHL